MRLPVKERDENPNVGALPTARANFNLETTERYVAIVEYLSSSRKGSLESRHAGRKAQLPRTEYVEKSMCL